ncbi:hypothetical protein HRbin17_00251 [bacterium HR17]|jgi:hypothetical protein|uniref:Uncharacterized protein n=1 Tax=Candidatus Fervidibacter japonicus TaxID=2035412 RepID=A0A2H5X997_9BACT|nr:hypothetical protein HRbin17_00251 [bacterium HR17]
MQCPRCRADNLDERVYCWQCLAPLRSSAMGPLPTPTATAVPKAAATRSTGERRSPPVALLAVIGAGILIGLGVAAYFLLRSPQQPSAPTPATTPTTPTAVPMAPGATSAPTVQPSQPPIPPR